MLPPLPRCSRWAYLSLKNRPAVSAFPDSTFGSACTLTFSRIARRLLTLRPAHSRGHQFRDRYPGASDISSPSCLPRLLPAGAVAGRGLHPLDKRRLVTAHVETGPSPTRVGATGLRRKRSSWTMRPWHFCYGHRIGRPQATAFRYYPGGCNGHRRTEPCARRQLTFRLPTARWKPLSFIPRKAGRSLRLSSTWTSGVCARNFAT